MTRELRQAIVVITGASSGIGRAAALAFAAHGRLTLVRLSRWMPNWFGRFITDPLPKTAPRRRVLQLTH
jgi:L-alanine-DL-glutamate epimerase-like enolase superfamily enzyme